MRFRIDLKILIFLVLFYFTGQLRLYFWTLVFAFFHELGHLIVGLILKLKPNYIELTPFGFFLKFHDHINSKQNIVVTLAGPLTSLVLAFIFAIIHIPFIPQDESVYCNLFICGFNLLFIYPLDGSRIIKSILKIIYNENDADIVTNRISNITLIILTMIGSIGIYIFKNIYILLLLIYLWILVIKDNKRIKLKIETLNLLKK